MFYILLTELFRFAFFNAVLVITKFQNFKGNFKNLIEIQQLSNMESS